MKKGIPGIKGTEHIGFTVPNLKEAVDFFENIIGAEVLYNIGPFESADDLMQKHLNVNPRAKIPSIAIVKLGNGANFEIFEYEVANQNKVTPKNSDVGGSHIALYVDNISEAVEYLRSKNIQLLGDITTMTEGPSAGESWIYFLSPWGMQLELVSYPNGKQYENNI